MINKLNDKGIIFVAASGRGITSIENKLNHKANNLYIISDNGAAIKHQDEIIDSTNFSQQGIENIVEAFNNVNSQVIVASTVNNYYAQIISDEYEEVVKRYFHKYEIVSDITQINDKYINVSMYSDSHNFENYNDPHVESLKDEHAIVISGDYWIDAMPKGINKGNALKKLLKHLDIDSNHTIAFGDYHNDIEMLKTVKVGYAMKTLILTSKKSLMKLLDQIMMMV